MNYFDWDGEITKPKLEPGIRPTWIKPEILNTLHNADVFIKQPYMIHYTLCDCDCHEPGKAIMHFMACCMDGYKLRYIKL